MKQQIAKLVGISELSIPEETFKILEWVPEVGACALKNPFWACFCVWSVFLGF